MEYRRSTVIVGLLSLVVGALAGIGTVQYAQIVAFSGADPNAAKDIPLAKQSDIYRNQRGDRSADFWEINDTAREGVRQLQQEDPTVHGAAPAVVEPEYEECAQTQNARRRVQCNENVKSLVNETKR